MDVKQGNIMADEEWSTIVPQQTEEEKIEIEIEGQETEQEEPIQIEKEEPVQAQQEKKQEKAKQIIEGLPNSYDPVSQITTLALVNALGPNITTYQSQVVQPQPIWYAPEEIYTDAILPDPLGNYISVRSNLQIEKMIGQQYE